MLKKNSFTGLRNLRVLLLNANSLSCIEKNTFYHVPSLKFLSLYDNKMKSLSQQSFGQLPKLTTLHLGKNPLICDCNLKWLAEKNIRETIETSGAKCEYPRKLRKKTFSSLPLDKFRCKGQFKMKMWLTLIIAESELHITKLADSCFIDNPCPVGCDCFETTVDCGLVFF